MNGPDWDPTGPRPAEPGGRAVLSVQFILLPHFTLMPFSALIDALRLAGDDGDLSRQIHCHWTIAGPNRQPVKSSCGVAVEPWETFGDPSPHDYIVVCGGLLHRGPQADEATLAYLRLAADRGVKLVGICTGSFALVRAGVMEGRRCCVSWYHYQDFVQAFPGVTPVADRLYLVDGNRITCAGGQGAIDLAAWLIEHHCGRAWAQKSLRIMLVDQGRDGLTPQPHPPLQEPAQDERVRRALLLLEQNLGQPMTVAAMAARLNLSTRQLERLFKDEFGVGPLDYERRFRLNYALWLLTRTRRTITQIAADCGFADSSHFSRVFKQTFGRTPGAMRAEDAPPLSEPTREV